MQRNNADFGLKINQELVRETIKDLDGIMNVSMKDQMKDLAKSVLGRSVRAKDPMFWPAGMLILGLVEARGAQSNDLAQMLKEIDTSIINHVSLWKDGYKSKIDYIDDALAGAALLKLYMQSDPREFSSANSTEKQDEARGEQTNINSSIAPSPELYELCKYTADKIYEYLLNAPRDPEGTIIYNPGRNAANVFADGVGQTSMFLALYGKIFNNKEALDLARIQLLNYKKYGCDERSELIYHGYSLEKDYRVTKKGLLSWGRAAGWLIMGLSEYVSAVCNRDTFSEDDGELRDWYMNLSETLWSYQREDGCFSWQVQAMDGPVDTWATGMIMYGLVNGISSSVVSKDKINRAVSGMQGNISSGRVMNALSSCDDFGVHYQTYGHYPWGQGAVLAALSLMSKKLMR